MKKLIIGIDVDQTIVDSHTEWLNWMYNRIGREIDMNELHSTHWDFDKEDFWRNPKLYDNYEPCQNSTSIIKQLMKEHHVVFISSCFPSHVESKYKFLKTHFGNDISFIDTYYKYRFKCDVFIDDSTKQLRRMQQTHNSICLKVNLPHIQSDEFQKMSWDEIYDYIQTI